MWTLSVCVCVVRLWALLPGGAHSWTTWRRSSRRVRRARCTTTTSFSPGRTWRIWVRFFPPRSHFPPKLQQKKTEPSTKTELKCSVGSYGHRFVCVYAHLLACVGGDERAGEGVHTRRVEWTLECRLSSHWILWAEAARWLAAVDRWVWVIAQGWGRW